MDAKKNAYWIAMGVLALGAAIFWAVAVWQGKNVQVDTATKALKKQVDKLTKFARIDDDKVADPNEGMPVPKIAEYWETLKKGFESEKAAIETKYRSRDADFDALPVGVKQKDGTLDYTEFITAFHKEVDELKSRYKALTEDGAKADKVFAFTDPQPGQEKEIILAQKRFYMARAVAEAAKDAKAQELVSLEWKEVTGSDGKDAEGKTTKGPITRIGLTARVDIAGPQVATLISKVLRAKVMFDIREVRVEAVPFSVSQYDAFKVFPAQTGAPAGGSGSLKGFAQDIYLGTQDLANPKTKNEPPPLAEPPVGVWITVDALDFDLPETKEGK